MWPPQYRIIARNIAAVFLSGVWTERAMTQRLATALGAKTKVSQKRLVAEIFSGVDAAYPPSIADLTKRVLASPAFERAAARALRADKPIRIVLRSPRFSQVPALTTRDVPELPTSGDVAQWLALPIEQLDWFTDARRSHRETAIPVLQHYTCAFRAKTHGPPRLIEAPKPRLKTMQRRILHAILDAVPAHDAAHGFVRGRSCKTAAALHLGAHVVVGLDIENFFPSTPLGRVHALFRSLGYPDSAARVLTRLCSTVTPDSVLDRIPNAHRHSRAALAHYTEPHLPQGAPTSPALANLVAWRLDVRLTALARTYHATYTRYADDLTFSGGTSLADKAASLIAAVTTILADEGYALNERKTRIMTPAQCQRVTGIVVNTHPNVPRTNYDQLKAVLHNCLRNGLDAENRNGHADFRAHLAGRVGWVEHINPVRGAKLRAMLDAIA